VRSLSRFTVVFLIGLLAFSPLHAATGTIAPFPKHVFLNNSGLPCVGCKLFTYSAGTTTKVNSYTEVTLSSANTNPIVLDSAGRATIFLTPGISYKFVLAPSTDTDPPIAAIWTVDNVDAVPSNASNVDVLAVAGEAFSAGDAVYESDGQGSRTAGSWYKMDADFAYASTEAPVIGIALTAAAGISTIATVTTSGRVVNQSGLAQGSMYYASATAGALTSTAPTLARAVLFAAGSTSGNIARDGYPKFAYPPVGVPTYARQTANVTKNNSTVFGDLTGLSFTVGASQTWDFRYTLFCTSAAAADIKFTLTGPAAPTAIRYGLLGSDGGSSTAFSTATTMSTLGTVEQTLTLAGTLRNGTTAGTVQIQMAQNIADVSNTICSTDSAVIAWRIN
jgi:hypothetical protein